MAGICLLLVMGIFASYSPVVYVANDNVSSVIISPTDNLSGALINIDFAHHKVHEGDHYNYRDFYDILRDGNKSFLIITPNSTIKSHLIVAFESLSSTFIIEFFENCTVSNNGSLVPVRNRNRNFPNGNTVLLYEDPIITSVGTEIFSGIYGAGRNSAGGGVRDTEEIVLRVNENYCFSVTEQNIQATSININFDWYENG